MTMPSLINNYRHKVLESQFKKGYSALSRVVLQIQNDTGEPLNVKDYSYQYTGDKWKLYNAIKPYIIANFCSANSCINRETIDDSEQNMKNYKTYNGATNTSSYFMECGSFIIPDGMAIYVENWNANCLMLSIDVNGENKPPNRWGHDLFTFAIDNNNGRLISTGVDGTCFAGKVSAYCSNSSSDKDNGITCSYYALTDPNYFKNLPK